MTERVRGKQVHEALRQYLRNRPDVGLNKAICDAMFEAANPFDGKAVRPPRRWFVLSCLVSALVFGCFSYFNNLL
jgi:hypothetical protein